MKFKITACIQCGHEFKITNPKKVYCRPACRSAAHRDRHGYEQPIFKYEEIKAMKELQEIDKLNIESNGSDETEVVKASSNELVDNEMLSKLIGIIERIQDKKSSSESVDEDKF